MNLSNNLAFTGAVYRFLNAANLDFYNQNSENINIIGVINDNFRRKGSN